MHRNSKKKPKQNLNMNINRNDKCVRYIDGVL